MTQIIKEKDVAGFTVITTVPGTVADVAADGIGPIIAGFPMTKLAFFQQKFNNPENLEHHREVVTVVTLPTLAILACADQIRAGLSANMEMLEKTFDSNRAIITGPDR